MVGSVYSAVRTDSLCKADYYVRSLRGYVCINEICYNVQIAAPRLRQAVISRRLAPEVRVSPSAQSTLRFVEK